MQLYVYEHCPFCSRVRYAAGAAGRRVSAVVLSYADVATPTALVGRKVAPILVEEGKTPMPESLDIIRYLTGANDEQMTLSANIADWQSRAFPVLQGIGYPRWYKMGLGEYATEEAKAAWIENKQKAAGCTFAELDARSSEFLQRSDELVQELVPMILSGQLAQRMLDAAVVFSILRGLYVAPVVGRWPTDVVSWLEQAAKTADAPLFI